MRNSEPKKHNLWLWWVQNEGKENWPANKLLKWRTVRVQGVQKKPRGVWGQQGYGQKGFQMNGVAPIWSQLASRSVFTSYVVLLTWSQSSSLWSIEYGGSIGVWLLKLAHERHCHFSLAFLDQSVWRKSLVIVWGFASSRREPHVGRNWGLSPRTNINLMSYPGNTSTKPSWHLNGNLTRDPQLRCT